MVGLMAQGFQRALGPDGEVLPLPEPSPQLRVRTHVHLASTYSLLGTHMTPTGKLVHSSHV